MARHQRLGAGKQDLTCTGQAGAGNAYSAALGYNLALLLPGDASPDGAPGGTTAAAEASPPGATDQEREARKDAVLLSACRASATGAAAVRCEGMPVPSATLQEWLHQEAAALKGKVRALQLRRAADVGEDEAAALTPPPAPAVVSRRGRGRRGRGNVGAKSAPGRDGSGKISKDRGEEAGTSASGTATGARGRGRGKRGRGGRGAE